MTDLLIPPAFLLVLAGLLLPLLHHRMRQATVVILPLGVLGFIWSLDPGAYLSVEFMQYELSLFNVTATGRLFATVFSIMLFAGGVFALHQAKTLELAAAFVYGGSAIGVCFSGDLISLFIYWEIMALGSTAVLWAAGTERAYAASFRYLLIHFLGGVILMAGIAWYVVKSGSIEFGPISLSDPGAVLILIGFLINAGAPPLSAWIADAYPEASPSGTVFLSAFTTKTAVYVLMVAFAGAEILIYIGLYMVFYGIIYALLENDMRRILAYSIVNQVGFMVCAIGIGTELALNGAAAHAFAHIIYKALLLMSAGSVLMMAERRKCSELGGLFQTMPVTALNGIVGALAISAFPFTSGFVTKSLESAAAADAGLVVVWFCLMAASAGVFLHAGIKFPWFVFFQKDSGLRPSDPPLNMKLAMWLFSFFCIAIGVFPAVLYGILPFPVDYKPYTSYHLVSQFQLLLFAGFAFFAMLPLMKRTLTISLDFDWFYRRFLRIVASEFTLKSGLIGSRLEQTVTRRIEQFIARLYQHHGPHGVLARTWPSGGMVLWVAVMLAGLIVASALF
ncbi:MAG: Na(+)/H(+) antiporter subunit D [Pseudomonadota bacterium]